MGEGVKGGGAGRWVGGGVGRGGLVCVLGEEREKGGDGEGRQ